MTTSSNANDDGGYCTASTPAQLRETALPLPRGSEQSREELIKRLKAVSLRGYMPAAVRAALIEATAMIEDFSTAHAEGLGKEDEYGVQTHVEPQHCTGWRDIASAPRDETTIQARIPGHGDDNLIAWIPDALENEHGPCGAWTFTSEQEPPPCWSDGWCWAVNEDGVRSAWPTHWKPAPPSSAEVADREGSRDTDKSSSPTLEKGKE